METATMKILVTGGCGFIGSNIAMAFHKDGHEVKVIDDLSRPNTKLNRKWLQDAGVNVVVGDAYEKLVLMQLKPDVIFHYAAQVGVQSSIDDRRNDFERNILLTFNILEYAKDFKPLVIFPSTNKVYGDMQVSVPTSETQPLSFCTPYGCSKGAAEQYVLDYAKTLGVPGVVLRMSCIYGNRQMGTEEQGWLCHFTRAKHSGDQITIYGDGTQIRDCLYIDDYVRLCKMLVANKDKVSGKAFNIGGGVHNQISVNEALKQIGVTNIAYSDWRPSDQKYYVSDIQKIRETIGWEPKIGLEEGLDKLDKWVRELASLQSQTGQGE